MGSFEQRERAEISIALAKPEDAEEIQKVVEDVWRATYPNQEAGISLEDIQYHLEQSSEQQQQRKKRAHDPSRKVSQLVAREGRKVVGFCTVIVTGEENEIRAINVLPEAQGKGVGTALWQAAQGYFDDGKDIKVNVATYNDNAIRFYERLGFEDTGKRFTEERFRMKSGSIIPEMEMRIRHV